MKLYQNHSVFKRISENTTMCLLSANLVYKCPFTNKMKEVNFQEVGFSHCHSDDNFDTLRGQRIAESRASIKLYKQINKFFKKEILKVEHTTKAFVKNYNKVNTWLTTEKHHLESLKDAEVVDMNYITKNIKPGFKLNDKIANNIIKAINRNNGHCPCDNDSIDTICPCSNYREKDYCCCRLYVKE